MLDIACGKSGHSSALLNVNLTFQFLECTNLLIILILQLRLSNIFHFHLSPIQCYSENKKYIL